MTRLKVAVRVRPISKRELDIGSTSVISVENEDTLEITNLKVPEQNTGDSRQRIRRFAFDCCFRDSCTQDQVFESIEKVISKSVKQRCHSCVLAYGQSSTGKTHTMMGVPEDPGITPKLCRRLFDYLEEAAIVGDEVFNTDVTVSYLEIYNEKVRDLLQDEQTDEDKIRRKKSPLKVREHPKKGPYVQGLSEHPVSNPSDLLDWLEKGDKKRKVAATLSNPRSSRSHSVFSVNCAGVKLNLIDLAGSERAANRCFDLSRFKEGANINKSLVALGNVISALAEQSTKQKGIRRKFVPYRDSVLTWLLKDILGGNSNTVMVATISPSSACYSETVNTLRFGQRAKNIVARPVVNEDPKERTIRELRAEIYRLREVLDSLQISPHTQMNDKINDLTAENQDKSNTTSSNQSQSRLQPVPVQSKNPTLEKQNSRDSITNTEQLLPLINVTSSVNSKRLTQLKRTFSVDQPLSKMDNNFGSNDSLPSTSTKSIPSTTPSTESLSSRRSSIQSSLRRKSLNKSIPSLPRATVKRGSLEATAKKIEKAISTDHLPQKTVESRVDSIRRRPSAKPRSQIVAAVTSRLYSKLKNKEVSTDTDDINTYNLEEIAPKELQICENARNRLKEITKRALRAHRSRNEETQTDLNPVRRVKETSTDVSDLKLELLEVREAETSCDPVQTKDASVSCACLDSCSEGKSLLLTRSCGTQCEENKPMSFTKYLRDIQEDLPPNPIYTNAVNIKISNNYHNGEKVSGKNFAVQVGAQEEFSGCLATPDLLSNHNSLEHNQATKETQKLFHESSEKIDDVFGVAEAFSSPSTFSTANCSVVPNFSTSNPSVKLTKTYAPEILLNKSFEDEYCLPLPIFEPKKAMPNVLHADESRFEEAVLVKEPLILKSIVKHQGAGEQEEPSALMDSLDYHRANKKVKFVEERKDDQQRMFKAMSSFLEEATKMMSKLEKSTSTSLIGDYDLEVTLNDKRATRRHKKKSRHPSCPAHRPNVEEKFIQTASPRKTTSSTQCDGRFGLPPNRYEVVLEDSCKRLEEKIRWIPEARPRPPQSDFCEDTSCGFAEDRRSSDLEEFMGESPVAFSDYGSLPRKRYTTWSRCSPSAYLRQLTHMRRQIVRSSREDLDSEGFQ
ncbi:unnamed protein product [Phaedon cochleariae]|uniref:Kinesin motor domain-containing protein n=1 Tax=Phaedon cochleariae TaxID=80249 RepID=A0A9N9WXJ8_PHACE|nr:unnamed protein product [Phaedon cochleariae]